MKEFKTLAEAANAFVAESQKNEVLAAELKEVNRNFEEAYQQAAEAQQTLAQLKQQNETLKTEIEALKSDAATVDQKVTAALAGLAVPPVASVQGSEPAANKLSVHEQLAQIKDPMQRAIFRRDNFDELLKNR
jgi:chromosome segregation ATPase